MTYNSQAGNGWVGLGWSLDAGSIHRKTSSGVPTYNNNIDSFVVTLNGGSQDLIPVGGNIYKPQIESNFMQFKMVSASEWDAWDKSGKKFQFFGLTANTTNYYDWDLETVTDPNGNQIQLTSYHEFISTSSVQISSGQITYTEISSGGYKNQISYELESRPDILTNWRAGGVEQQISRRLKRIIVSSAGSPVRKYEFTYSINESSQSLLTSIQLFGYDVSMSTWIAYPSSTTFQYTVAVATWQANSQWSPPVDFSSQYLATYSLYRGAQLIDVNGDGFADIVRRMGTDNNAYLNNLTGYSSSSAWNLPVELAVRVSTDGNTNDDIAVDQGVRFVDLNGDGLIDIVQYQTGSSSYAFDDAWINTGNGWVEASQWKIPTAIVQRNSATQEADLGVRFVDLNGDGLPDIIQSVNNAGVTTNNVWLNTGNGWVADSRWTAPTWISIVFSGTPPPIFVDPGIRFVDLNGDGLIDMIQGEIGLAYSGVTCPGGGNCAYRAWINTGSSWTLVSQWAPPVEFSDDNNGTVLDPGTRLVDINGDGLVDIVVSNGSAMHAWLNSVNGWTQNDNWAPTLAMTNWSQPSLNYLWLNRILQDAPYTSGQPSLGICCGINSTDNGIAFGDVNGDGLVDFVQGKGGTVGTNLYQAWVSTAAFPNKLIFVKNELGGTVNVQYSSYTQSTNLPFSPMTVVSSMTTSDGMGGRVTMNYNYRQGLMVNSGANREFLGFRQVTTTDAQGNYTNTLFLQNDNAVNSVNLFKGKIAEQDVYDSSGTLLTKTVNTYSYATPSNGVYFPFLSQVDTYVGTKQSEIQYQYDAYGNLSQEYDLGDISTTGDERTTNTDYSTTSVSGYLVGYPIHKKVLNASTSTASETWITYDTNTVFTQNLIHGLPTKTENWLSGSTNTVVISSYDAYGNLTNQYDALWNATSGAKGNHTQNTYDTSYHQFLSTSTQGAGSLNLTETFLFDPFNGQVSSHTDVNNQTTQYQYDDFGRLSTVSNSSDTLILPTISYQYNISTSPPHSIVSHARIVPGTSPTLDTYTFFDGMGRKRETKVTGSTGTQIVSDVLDFNTRGLISNTYVPYTVTSSTSFAPENTSIPKSTMTYDGLGRVTTVVAPDGSTTTTAYQNWNRTVIDANGHTIDYTYDAYGRLVLANQHNLGLTNSTTYQYNVLDNIIQITNSLAQNTTFTYDTLGRKTGINDPQTGSWQYQYDANGNLTQQTDAKGQPIQMTYDRINRLASKIYSDSTTLTYQYDAGSFGKGHLSQATDLSETQTFSYDNLGRVTQEARLINGTTYYTQMGYDDMGRETSVIYPNNNKVQSYFDGVFLSSAQDTQSGLRYAAMTYDTSAVGKIRAIVYGSSITASYTYKPNNFYLNTLISTTSTSQTLQSFAYNYDNVGNISSITDSVGGMSQTFQYDDLNRVTVSSGPYGYRTYQYDSFGNMTYNSDNTSGSWGFEDLSQISTIQGLPTLSNGRLGTGLYLDGNTIAQLTNSGRLSPTNAISVELWLRPLSLGTTGYLMSKLGEFYFPKLNPDGSLDAQLSLTSGGQAVHVSSAVSYNIWSHLVMTYDGSAVRVYVNGVFKSSQTASGTVLPSTSAVLVGSGFTGTVDEINIHSRALSATEVLLRFQSAPNMAPNQPFSPTPPIANMASGQTNVSYGFGFQAWDLDGDQVNYQIDWGTGAVVYPRTGYVPSGTVVITSNTWTQAGQYNIRYAAVTSTSGVEVISPWSPTYNVFIATGITTQLGGPFFSGAEAGISQSASYISSNTAGEWIVALSTSSNYQAYLGYQGAITSTSSTSALYLGWQGAGGAETTPPTKLSTGSFVNLVGTTTADVNQIALGLRQNGYTQVRDANGSLKLGSNRWIKFDFENRPIETITPDGTKTLYSYDFEGNRVQQIISSTTTTISSSTYVGQIYEITGSTTIQYISAGSMRVALKSSIGNVFYYLPDHLGGTYILIGSTQGVVRTNKYDPFGGFFNTVGTQDSDYKYTGQRLDIQPDLYFYNARYYDPLLAVFISADPTFLQGQKEYLLIPGNLNVYVYAGNNPIRNTDPTGLDDSDPFGDNPYRYDPFQFLPTYDQYLYSALNNASNALAGYGDYLTSFFGLFNNSLTQMARESLGSNQVVDPNSGPYAIGKSGAVFTGLGAGAGLASFALEGAVLYGPTSLGAGIFSLGGTAPGITEGEIAGEVSASGLPESSASAPVGRLGQPLTIPEGLQINIDTTIGGREYAGHALDAMQNRGIMPSVVEEAIQYGIPSPGNVPGRTVFTDLINQIRVITDSITGKVITVITGTK